MARRDLHELDGLSIMFTQDMTTREWRASWRTPNPYNPTSITRGFGLGETPEKALTSAILGMDNVN